MTRYYSACRANRSRIVAFAAALGLISILPITAHAQDTALPAVGVVALETTSVTDRQGFVGRAEAIDRIDLRARVTGFLEQRLFDEGGMVTAGDRLFAIEKAPYEAALAQFEATLASAEAETANAAAQLARGEELLATRNIPEAEVDERRAALLVAEARVLEAQAAIRSATLDLSYTDVMAPVTGRISRSTYSVGALIGPESEPLATIVSQDPIHVTFPVAQALLTEGRQTAIEEQRELDFVVYVELPTGEVYAEPGRIAFVEVEVDPLTDTLPVTATFPNPDGLLTPGQFLNVIVEVGEPRTALVLPGAALLADQAGHYVLVVGEGDQVEQRRVAIGAQVGAGFVVEDGLQPAERVIVDGIQKVRPGQIVAPTTIAAVPRT